MTNRLTTRPTLNLARNHFDRPFHVDMERFFEFSFDLAEDLLDLELKFATEPTLVHNPKSTVRTESGLAFELDFEIDASWM